jgi:hypothetical protein
MNKRLNHDHAIQKRRGKTANCAPGIALSGNVGDSLELKYCDSLVPAPNWQPPARIAMTHTTQVYVDGATASCGQRFYRGVSAPTLTLTDTSRVYMDTLAPGLSRSYRAVASP